MAAEALLWMVLPAVVYGSLASAFLEPEPPRWRVRLGRSVGKFGGRILGPLGRWRTRRAARRTPPPDPFTALSVQVRLGLVAAQLRALEEDPHAWARGKRLQATQAAYDALLAEACRLAGVEVAGPAYPGALTASEPERFREEMELASRGWSW